MFPKRYDTDLYVVLPTVLLEGPAYFVLVVSEGDDVGFTFFRTFSKDIG